ncbi:MAG: transglutaminase domain-containing protein [Ktedonobacteraceae bacterium]|nr:transglutaminase domain-containing protein [Ktedonobacteraceae bacterium]
MDATQVLQYYREHTTFTDPGKYAALYKELPRDVPGLARVVQGLLIPPYGELLRNQYHVDPEEIDNEPFGPFGPRRMEALIERIQIRHAAPLAIERPPILRIGVICRNYAVLLASMLRQQGIPARARVGFGGYFASVYAVDHRITEYWHEAQQRWVRVDSMIDEVQRAGRTLTFDTLDIGPGDPFWLAGEVWQRCRAGELDPQDFGDSDIDRGMPPIRYALLHDFAYLNKCEVLGCDAWGELISKPEAELTRADLALLDQIAVLTTQVDTHFEELRVLFAQTDYGRVVHEQIAVRV